MRKLILHCSFLLLTGTCCSQVAFQCRYEWAAVDHVAETVKSIFPAPDNSGYLGLHYVHTSQDTGFGILKIGNDGSITWSNIYKAVSAGPSVCSAEKMMQLSDSSIMVMGTVDGTHCSFKLDYSGNLIAARSFPFATGIFSEREVNGFLYSVGSSYSSGIHGGLFCKRNLNGDVIWSVKMSGGTSRSVRLTCLTPTSDNGFLLAGWRYYFNIGSPTPPTTPILIKTDSVGTIQWQTQLNFAGIGMQPIQVEEMTDHSFMFSMSAGSQIVFLRTDSIGQVLWNYFFNDNNQNQNVMFTNFVSLPNDQFMTCGTAFYKILPIIIDSTGNLLMAKEITHGDSAQVESFYYNQSEFLGLGHKSTFLARALFVAKTDSAFHGACGDSNISLDQYSLVVTDSAISYVAIPVSISVTNADTSIAIFNYPMTQSDYCPPVYLTTSDEQSPLPVSWGPVPTHEIVTFTTVDSNKKLLKIFDVTGSLVEQVSYSGNSYSFNRSNLNSGIFIFELVSGDAVRRGKIMFE